MSGTLTFSAAEVKRLYQHSQAATEHSPSFSQALDPKMHKGGVMLDSEGKEVKLDRKGAPIDGWPDSKNVDTTKVPAGLWLVGDQGVYLMSNGTPGDRISVEGDGGPGRERHFVAYAAECNPDKLEFDDWWDAKNRIFGGDDGSDYLPLSMFEKVLGLDDDAKVKIKLTASKISVVIDEPKARVVIKDGMEIKLDKPMGFKGPGEGDLNASHFRILDAKTGSAVALDMTRGDKPMADTRVKLNISNLRDRIRSGEAKVIVGQDDAAKPAKQKMKG